MAAHHPEKKVKTNNEPGTCDQRGENRKIKFSAQKFFLATMTDVHPEKKVNAKSEQGNHDQ